MDLHFCKHLNLCDDQYVGLYLKQCVTKCIILELVSQWEDMCICLTHCFAEYATVCLLVFHRGCPPIPYLYLCECVTKLLDLLFGLSSAFSTNPSAFL